MIQAGDLVSHGLIDEDCGLIGCSGIVIDAEVNITKELIEHGDNNWIIEACRRDPALKHEPPGAVVAWGCGDVDMHYCSELEVISDNRKQWVV